MNGQNISWSERIQACFAHLLILFLFAASAVIMYFKPFAEPVFHFKLKFFPLDLFLEWAVNLSIRGWFFWIFLTNYFLLSLLSKLTTISFIKDNLYSARDFTLTCLIISIVKPGGGRGLLRGLATDLMTELADTSNARANTLEVKVGIYVIFSLISFIYLLWYSQVLFAAFNSIRGKVYDYLLIVGIKFRGRKL